MVAEVVDAVIGVDTHRDSHEVEIADPRGTPIATMRIGNDSAGFTQILAAVAEDLNAETAASIADVRRLVYDLRPPALDELGLVTALRQQADRVSVRDGTRHHLRSGTGHPAAATRRGGGRRLPHRHGGTDQSRPAH
jgi:signal transduction histidine kinase